MLSNSCKYGIRAVIYLALHQSEKNCIGIKEIAGDLDLPTPFLAKILQQLAKQKLLNSIKGPNGGFSLLKNPESITMYDIVKTIDGEELFTNCIIHDSTCMSLSENKKFCAVHDDYDQIRKQLIELFKRKTISELAYSAGSSSNVLI